MQVAGDPGMAHELHPVGLRLPHQAKQIRPGDGLGVGLASALLAVEPATERDPAVDPPQRHAQLPRHADGFLSRVTLLMHVLMRVEVIRFVSDQLDEDLELLRNLFCDLGPIVQICA